MKWRLLRNFFIILIIILLIFQISLLYDQVKLYDALTERPLVNSELNYETVEIEEVFNDSDYQIIDMREKEEFERSHIPGALNYRTADIIRNENVLMELNEISKEKTIVLYCFESDYNGDGAGRSGLAASFLNSKNISAFVLSDGAKGLYEKSKEFPEFWESYNQVNIFPNRKKIIDKLEYFKDVYYVDINRKNIFVKKEGDPVYSTDYTAGDMTSEEWGELMRFMNKNHSIAICYDNPTCFFANIFGIRLDSQGGKFEGYYLDIK